MSVGGQSLARMTHEAIKQTPVTGIDRPFLAVHSFPIYEVYDL